MRTTLITGSVALAALIGFAAQLQAELITGSFSINGSVELDKLAYSATQVVSYSDVKVASDPTGVFKNYFGIDATVTMATPWKFTESLDNFWEVGGFTFDLLSVTKVSREGSELIGAVIVEGLGRVSGHNFDPTLGTIKFRADDLSPSFKFSASTAATGRPATVPDDENTFTPAPSRPTPVPDGGTTLALLGCGLSLLGAATRKLTR